MIDQRVLIGNEKVIQTKKLASHYLQSNDNPSQSPSRINRNLHFNLNTFSVRNYTSLRFEYRLALADVAIQDTALGFEIALWLQNVVDIADLDRPDLTPSILSRKRLNPFEYEQEKCRIDMEKREIQRIENLEKRRRELKNILVQNSDVIKEKKKERNMMLNRSTHEESKLSYLRSPEYLKELKNKSVEIKQRKQEVKEKVDEQERKQKETSFFLKKKKAIDFTDKRSKEISESFIQNHIKRNQERSQIITKRQQEEAKNKQELTKMIRNHTITSVIQDYKQVKQKEMELNLIESIEQESDWHHMERIYKMYLAQQGISIFVSSPRLSYKNTLKSLLETRIIPQLTSSKRAVETYNKCIKYYSGSHMNTGILLEEYQMLLLMISIDNMIDEHIENKIQERAQTGDQSNEGEQEMSFEMDRSAIADRFRQILSLLSEHDR